MIIDCDTCTGRHSNACGDCVVSSLIGANGILELVDAEVVAIDALSDAGLVAPIRLVSTDIGIDVTKRRARG